MMTDSISCEPQYHCRFYLLRLGCTVLGKHRVCNKHMQVGNGDGQASGSVVFVILCPLPTGITPLFAPNLSSSSCILSSPFCSISLFLVAVPVVACKLPTVPFTAPARFPLSFSVYDASGLVLGSEDWTMEPSVVTCDEPVPVCSWAADCLISVFRISEECFEEAIVL